MRREQRLSKIGIELTAPELLDALLMALKTTTDRQAVYEARQRPVLFRINGREAGIYTVSRIMLGGSDANLIIDLDPEF